ncbi:MAG: DNRLRE domain-containing protein, partial [Kiritimatiellia bacterium]|nr:DNRLRE domain-containing protein [Kiritimatiellia bacterium]
MIRYCYHMHRSMQFLLALSVLAVTDLQVAALTTNLTVIADTFLVARDPNNNVGAGTHIAAGRDGKPSDGRRRGLYLFDLSGIDAEATVTSVVFRVSVVKDPQFGDVNSSFALHRVSADWGEGNKALGLGNRGSPASTGEATWNARLHNTASWSTAGGDYVTTASAVTPVTGIGAYEWSGTVLVDDVQAWIDGSAVNHGLLLLSQSEGTGKTARRFGSREDASPATLEVGYTLPAPEETAIQSVATTNGSITFTWNSFVSQKYDVQYARDILARIIHEMPQESRDTRYGLPQKGFLV